MTRWIGSLVVLGLVGTVVNAQGPQHVVSGVVHKVDGAAKTIALKTKDGTESVYHLADDGVISAGEGVSTGAKATATATADAARFAADAAKTSGRVTVHYTEEGGKKIAHALHFHSAVPQSTGQP